VRLVSLVFRNFLYKIVAVLVAVVLWSATQGFRDIDMSVDVPIEIGEMPSDLVVSKMDPPEVNFKIVGSRWAVRRAVQKLQRYSISLAKAKPGLNSYDIEEELLDLPRGATIDAKSPNTVDVIVDQLIEKAVRVQVEVIGTVPPGFRYDVEVEPSVVTLRGGQTTLDNMRAVPTEVIDLSELRATTSRQVSLDLGTTTWPVDQKNATVRVLVRVIADRPPVVPELPPELGPSPDAGRS
jgi:YbbR domain-containing protein